MLLSLLLTILFPLVMSPQGKVVDQNNVPFLINGEAPWSLIAQLNESDVMYYLDNRENKRVNALLVNLIEHQFCDNPPYNYYNDAPFGKTGGEWDFTKPNEDYFAHADWVIQQAESRGMVVLLTPAYVGHNLGGQGWGDEINNNGETKCYQYGLYLGNRYKNFPNIIWVMGGDARPNGILAEENEIVRGIKDAGDTHLFTAHSKPERSAIQDYNEPWLDINTTYVRTGNPSDIKSKLISDYNKNMPFFFIEGVYENEAGNGNIWRAQMYYPTLTGGMGHVFGNCPIWHLGSDNGWCGTNNWKNALNSVGSISLLHYANLFYSRRYDLLEPSLNGSILTSGGTDVTIAKTSDNNTIILYMPSSRTVGIDLSVLNGSSVISYWYNPSNGNVTEGQIITTKNVHSFSPPGNGNWVLVIDNNDIPFPLPGQEDITDISLSVELTYFNGDLKNNKVYLEWRTESELENYGFEIYRENGSLVTFIDGQGNSSIGKTYNYIDNIISKKYFLYSISISGFKELEAEITIPENGKDITTFCYPNPFNNRTVIEFIISDKSKVSLLVYNINGELIETKINGETLNSGKHEVYINGSNLSSGNYFYLLKVYNIRTHKTQTLTKKMILLK